MFSGDKYRALLDFRSNRPDRDPGLGLLYLVLIPVFAGVGFVAWLGWNWLALTLTIVTFLLVGGVLVWSSRRRHERGRVPDPEWR